ncbi:MAG: hypothetical protein B6D65_05800 [candidate division Zixibacteria bacterium 4484_93]|nr:MAG: hypothetical protein B6D65_05800 [candidate division Zixibacteria bacterium 4484_93]
MKKGDDAITVTMDGKEVKITYEQLILTNNLTLQALITLLVKKEIVSPEELLAELQLKEKERLKKPED